MPYLQFRNRIVAMLPVHNIMQVSALQQKYWKNRQSTSWNKWMRLQEHRRAIWEKYERRMEDRVRLLNRPDRLCKAHTD